MNLTKSQRYLQLVTKFKNHVFTDPALINPHQVEGFNYDVINPWELWHNDLNAKVLFIGQDFSDTTYLIKSLNVNWKTEESNRTNLNLIDLFCILGHKYSFDEVDYQNKLKNPIFLTNAILGIKVTTKANLSLPVKDSWWRETAEKYLKELIDIIQPKHIITMSMTAYKAICHIYNLTPEKTVSDAIANNGKRKILNGVDLFVVNHCSPKGLITRNIQQQSQDWMKIRDLMEGIIYEEELSESSIKTIN